MYTANNTPFNGRPWSRAKPLRPLDPTSRQIERDADAAMTMPESHDYTGFIVVPDRKAPRRPAAPPPL